MKYFSIDLETTRISKPSPDAILMASVVFEDSLLSPLPGLTALPHFTCLIDHGENISGPTNPVAMAMNSWILLAVEFHKAIKTGKTESMFRQVNLDRGIPIETLDRAIIAAQSFPVMSLDQFERECLSFLSYHGGLNTVSMAGKNFGMFDYDFLPAGVQEKVFYRVLDPGSMFTDFKQDAVPPSLDVLKKRLGIDNWGVSHDAYRDALDVIAVFRTAYTK